MTQARSNVWWQGFVAGLVGYAVVALFFGVMNVVSGESFFLTAALLGHSLLGTEVASAVEIVRPAPVFAYNGLHLLLFLAFGFAASWAVEEVERHPVLWYLVFFVFLAGFFYNVALVTLFTLPVAARAVPWGSIVAANLLAALGMGTYLARRHPRFRARVEARGDPERPEG